MTVENISGSLSTKGCCRPRRGSNPRPVGRAKTRGFVLLCVLCFQEDPLCILLDFTAAAVKCCVVAEESIPVHLRVVQFLWDYFAQFCVLEIRVLLKIQVCGIYSPANFNVIT